jgi:O-antigen/teichoic acid export membrane protein
MCAAGYNSPPRMRSLSSVKARASQVTRRILTEEGLQTEFAWVLANRVIEFGLLFLLLKVATTQLGKESFGEYNLAEVTLVLMTSVLLLPVHDSYMRDYHGAMRRGEARRAGVQLLGWYVIVTSATLVLAGLLTGPLSRWFGLGAWTALAAGLYFAVDRWRFLGQELLNIRRERKSQALQNIAYLVLQVGAITLVVTQISPTASGALFASAAASLVFAVPSAVGIVRQVRALPPSAASRLPHLVRLIGIPTGILLVFQWLQSFADRYMVTAQLDLETVGHYVACYQVCGIPYQFLLRLFHTLLTPIAYQRTHDVDDPELIWAGDRVLLAGIGIQLLLGLGLVGLYALFGRQLIVLLTSAEYALPTATVVLLAGGRYMQAFSQSLQPIFTVHHQMGKMLWFRMAGAALTLAICWWGIRHYGVLGAAGGSMVALTIYSLGLIFGPGGCWWMVAAARRQALSRRRGTAPA